MRQNTVRFDSHKVVDPTTIQINSTTTFTALYIQQFTARFLDDTTELKSQVVDKNSTATAPSISSTASKVFNGWKVNGVIVNVATYSITQNTDFVADWIYKNLVTFMANDATYSSQYVENANYAVEPDAPTFEGKSFAGWSLDRYNVVDLSTVAINSDTTLYAVFVSNFAGQWTGSCITEGYSYSVTLLIFNSGMWLLDLIDETTSSSLIGGAYGFFSEESGSYKMSGFMLSPTVTLLENGSLQLDFAKAILDPTLTYVLTKDDVRVEQTYLVDFDKECTFVYNGNNYTLDVVFDGHSGTYVGGMMSPTCTTVPNYVLYNNKMYYYNPAGSGTMNQYCCTAFELTDNSITFGSCTGTFN